MTFIDDYTRMCWVYLLKQKFEAIETFKNFHVWIEYEAQSHIGNLRSDNGKEYTSNEFEKYLRQHGIMNMLNEVVIKVKEHEQEAHAC